MAAPSKAWVTISDSQVDADSPLDATLMTAIRDDLVHLEEWLGMDYTAVQNHDHDGANSKDIATAGMLFRALRAYPYFSDDFLANNITDQWTVANTDSGAAAIVQPGTDGIVKFNTNGLGTAQIHARLTRGFVPSATAFYMEARVRRFSAANPRVFRVGFADNQTPPSDEITIFADGPNADWAARTKTGAGTTDTPLSVGFDGNWHTLKIKVTSAAVTFWWDGAQKANHTTDITTVNLGPILRLESNAGDSAMEMHVDYYIAYSEGRTS